MNQLAPKPDVPPALLFDRIERYDDEPALVALIGSCAARGLGAGEPVVLISTKARQLAVNQELLRRFIDVERAVASGRLRYVDASALLGRMTVGPVLNPESFAEIRTLIADARAIAGPSQGVRIYDELQLLLHQAGRSDDAVMLTAQWVEARRDNAEVLRWAFASGGHYREVSFPLKPILRAEPTRRRLRESERRMRLLIDSIRDYAIFMLDATGHIATWNPGAERIKGYLADEIIGKHFSVFYTQEDIATDKCERELLEASETGRFEEEAWRVRKDGTYFWANVVISAVRDDDGKLIGFAKVTRDLTERRRAESQRSALLAAEQANRAKDEFLAMLSHELRNPLAPIVSALQIMKLRGGDESTREHEIIERHVHHVVRLVDDLLDVARITQSKMDLHRTRLQLSDVVGRSIDVVRPLLDQKGHRLTLAVPRDGLPLDGDETRLVQVVVNLLTNAAKYTPPGGHVEISGRRRDAQVELEIRDDGEGMSAELLPHVFDLFVQGERNADRAQGGLGIGLTLVKSLIQLHAGTVSVASDGAGKGTRFVVRLPAGVEASKPANKSPPRATMTREAALEILVVDDNDDASEMLGELLRMLGHEVLIARDGDSALELVAGRDVQLAILDIGLPGMDGYELARRLHEKLGPRCHLVALTGYGQHTDRQRSKEAGFDEHLVKPVSVEQLSRILQAVRARPS